MEKINEKLQKAEEKRKNKFEKIIYQNQMRELKYLKSYLKHQNEKEMQREIYREISFLK